MQRMSVQDGANICCGSKHKRYLVYADYALNAQHSEFRHQGSRVRAGSRTGVASAHPVDVLRSHVAEAQARANHIVDEFESMLLVTGGHSMKEVMQIQSQAGLASFSPPAVRGPRQVSVIPRH